MRRVSLQGAVSFLTPGSGPCPGAVSGSVVGSAGSGAAGSRGSSDGDGGGSGGGRNSSGLGDGGLSGGGSNDNDDCNSSSSTKLQQQMRLSSTPGTVGSMTDAETKNGQFSFERAADDTGVSLLCTDVLGANYDNVILITRSGKVRIFDHNNSCYTLQIDGIDFQRNPQSQMCKLRDPNFSRDWIVFANVSGIFEIIQVNELLTGNNVATGTVIMATSLNDIQNFTCVRACREFSSRFGYIAFGSKSGLSVYRVNDTANCLTCIGVETACRGVCSIDLSPQGFIIAGSSDGSFSCYEIQQKKESSTLAEVELDKGVDFSFLQDRGPVFVCLRQDISAAPFESCTNGVDKVENTNKTPIQFALAVVSGRILECSVCYEKPGRATDWHESFSATDAVRVSSRCLQLTNNVATGCSLCSIEYFPTVLSDDVHDFQSPKLLAQSIDGTGIIICPEPAVGQPDATFAFDIAESCEGKSIIQLCPCRY
jgi:hypothetical protein